MTSVLILGGAGFFGRWLVTHLVENFLVDEIRVLDKVIPECAMLSKRCQRAFKEVEFQQCNLIIPEAVERGFYREDGKPWDIVYNLACERRLDVSAQAYEENICTLTTVCARTAARFNARLFVQVSTGGVYATNDQFSGREDDPVVDPDQISSDNLAARYFLRADQFLLSLNDLNVIIIRPSTVYGPGDLQFIAQMMVVGRVHRELGTPVMSYLPPEHALNTVHVHDLARALWHAATWYRDSGREGPEIFNVSDLGNSTNGSLWSLISRLFQIQVKHHLWFMSRILTSPMTFKRAIDDANDRVVPSWSRLLRQAGIQDAILTPYFHRSHLVPPPMQVDAEKFTTLTGFEYMVPRVTIVALKDMIREWQELRCWPLPDTSIVDTYDEDDELHEYDVQQ